MSSNNACLSLLQNIEDSLSRKAISDIQFFNKLFCDLSLAKNAIIMGKNPDSDDNLTKIKMSDL